jgi:hypothetical protein
MRTILTGALALVFLTASPLSAAERLNVVSSFMIQ